MSGTTHKTVGPAAGARDHDADPMAIIEAIEAVQETPDDETLDWDWLPNLDLPSFGPERDSCGDEFYRFCESCGHVEPVGQTCKRAECRRCGANKIMLQSIEVAAFLDSLRRYRYASTPENQFFHHVTISPPDDWTLDHSEPLDRAFEVVREIMDELGIQGTAFYHPWRGDDEERGGADDRGEWRERLFEGREWRGDVRQELRFSPHFHVIGVAPFVPGAGVTEVVNEATDWVIHRITGDGDTNVSIPDDAAMARAVTYCLSHTGTYETDGGSMRLAYRHKGPDVNRVTADGETTDKYDDLVRSVAPITLGIEARKLGCVAQVAERAETAIGAVAERARHFNTASSGSASSSDDVLDDGAGDVPEATPGEEPSVVGEIDGEMCDAKMIPITRAGGYLADPEWRRDAQHVDELQTTWDDWTPG